MWPSSCSACCTHPFPYEEPPSQSNLHSKTALVGCTRKLSHVYSTINKCMAALVLSCAVQCSTVPCSESVIAPPRPRYLCDAHVRATSATSHPKIICSYSSPLLAFARDICYSAKFEPKRAPVNLAAAARQTMRPVTTARHKQNRE